MSEENKTRDEFLPEGSYFEHKAREEAKERQRRCSICRTASARPSACWAIR